MKKILLSSVALVGIAGTAVAADLPARMPVKAPPIMAPAFSWTGCYVGVNVGAARNDSDYTVRPTGEFLTNPAYIPTNSLRTDGGSLDDTGFTGGGQIGCNWQPIGTSFVFGAEGDLNWVGIDDTVAVTRALAAPLVGTMSHSISQSVDWFGTARLRAGFTGGQWLVYVTGGLAFAGLDSSTGVQFSLAGDRYAGSISDTRTGWTAGGGIEFAFDHNWSAKAEYLYVDLGSVSYLNANVAPPAFPTFSYTTDLDTKFHVARIGLNYRFGGGAPLVARY